LKSRRTVRVIPVGLGKNPMALALAPGGGEGRGYVSEFVAGSIDLVDLTAVGGVVDTTPLPASLPTDGEGIRTKPFPGGLVFCGGKLWAALANLRGDGGGLRAGGPGVVVAIETDPLSPEYHKITRRIVLEGRDTVSVIAPEYLPGTVVAVSAGDFDDEIGFRGNGVLEFIDVELGRVTGIIRTDGFEGGAAPFEAVVPGKTGFIADAKAGRLLLFDAETVKARLEASPTSPADLFFTLKDVIDLPGSEDVLSYASALAAWNGYLFVTEFNHDRLFVIEETTGRIVDEFLVGDGPDAIGLRINSSPDSPPSHGPDPVWSGHNLEAKGESYRASEEQLVMLPPGDRKPPVADAGEDRETETGRFVLFDGRGSSDDTAVVSYRWDFDLADGVGVDCSGPTVYHAFDRAGAYTVTLTVYDSAGNSDSDTARVVVSRSGGPRLVVEPRETFLRSGEEILLRAFLNGEPVTARWRSLSPQVAAVSEDGILSALSPGEALLAAEYGGVTKEALFHVDRDERFVFRGGSVYSVRPDRAALTVLEPEEEKEVALSGPGGGRALSLWAGREAFVSTEEGVEAVDLGAEKAQGGFAPGTPEKLASGARYLFCGSGGGLRAVPVAGGEPLEVPFEGAVRALGLDPWGRLWAASHSRVEIMGPGFFPGEGKLIPDSALTFHLEEARIGGFFFSQELSAVLLWGEERDVLYVLEPPIHDPTTPFGFSERIDPRIVPIVLNEEGLGLSGCWELSGGRFVAVSRKEGLVYIFELSGELAPVNVKVERLSFRSLWRLLMEEGEKPAAGVYADEVVEYAPKGRPGNYTDPLLALGGPRGGGVDTGSTHVVSLGDRTADHGPSDEGVGGALTVRFSGRIVYDGLGPDLVVFENPFSVAGGMGIYCEAAVVRVSQDGITWYEFPWRLREEWSLNDPRRYAGVAGKTPVTLNVDPADPHYFPLSPCDPAAGGDRFDLALLGLKWIRYVRIVDGGGVIPDSGNAPFFAERGADIDAVSALHTQSDPVP